MCYENKSDRSFISVWLPLQPLIKVRKDLNIGPWDSQQLGIKQEVENS